MSIDDFISAEERTGLLDGMVRGEYNLLLGAGASLGALGGDKAPLPGARDLAQELLASFGIDSGGRDLDLKLAYELVEGRRDRQARNRNEYLRLRFSQCSPTWHSFLASLRWRRIWTLNIDDVVESVYQRGDTAAQTARTYNWPDDFVERGSLQNELQVVHLHGCAFLQDPEAQALVFSITEYLSAGAGRHAWHQVFGSLFLQEPFIVIGARLTDEYDLADFLRRGNNAYKLTGRPSLLVLRQIPALEAGLFRKWGLVPVESDAQSFLHELISESSRHRAKMAPVLLQSGEVLAPHAISFLNQFRALRDGGDRQLAGRRDFYGGDEPNWDDIERSRDARFEMVDVVLGKLLPVAGVTEERARQQVHCIWGGPGSGKSTVLLRIAREVIGRGLDAYLFRGEERLDVAAMLWWLRQATKSVLFFDGLADVSGDIGWLLSKCAELNIRLLVVGTERESRLQHVYSEISPEYLLAGEEHKLDRLSDPDIEALLTKLGAEGRLGVLTRASVEGRRQFFVKQAGRQLFAGMAELEGGRGFSARIKREYLDDVQSQTLRNLYAQVCMAYVFGYALPVGIAATASGVEADLIIESVESNGALSGILRIEGKGLKPRHRVVASMVINVAVEREARYRLSQELARTLATHVSPSAISQRTLAYRIVRNLMDQDVVVDWAGGDRARSWFEGLSGEYGWNSRFWEQRALLEARFGGFPQARSYAERALQAQRHPFSLNTLGTVLLRMAVEYYEAGSDEAEEVFWEGVAHLRDARELRSRPGEGSQHPYVTFFSYAQRHVLRSYADQTVPARLATEWQRWMTGAENASVFLHTENRQMLQDFQRDWLLLATRSKRGG